MKKKKILFVIESLACAGAERSLINLLSIIDYTKYDIYLQLFNYSGELQKYLHPQVKVLKPLKYFKFCSRKKWKQLFSLDISFLFARMIYSLAIRCGKLCHSDKARILWRVATPLIKPSSNEYDIAIAYAHNFPTFYVANKVTANKKIAWVNVDLHLNKTNKLFQVQFYNKFSNIVTVSDSAFKEFQTLYPQFTQKTCIIYDILCEKIIKHYAAEQCALITSNDTVTILTVARLNGLQKGYDILLNTCKILKDRGVNFIWYAIGEGDYRPIIEKFISENHLENHFKLLGIKSNPYPYFNKCDLYVQTSRHEGYGLSIAEARILNKPVVTTEFDAVWNQMVQGKNGIVVPIDAIAVADAIQDLIENPEKRKEISDYQQSEKKGTIEELQKFYDIINE